MRMRSGATVIKKYANRRLYNTGTSSYVTLDDLAEMVKCGEDFSVTDAKSGEDITHTVLTQIIFEQESKSDQSILPVSFLRELISYYGDQMQAMLPGFLDNAMKAFAEQQAHMREQMDKALYQPQPGHSLSDHDDTVEPSPAGFYAERGLGRRHEAHGDPAMSGELDDLRLQLRALQARIDNL
ncbi:polyhydroxyalkanoate synthesis repressor PhaR [Martelella mediterranea]|uniref:Polyhydroxyalkanoate synthesis repressor PhaR n=1 Tax=Martelella mediterranea TaxID=293089 RepID=A0A4R3NIX1_9HYPH|nr:polyhydroxyalkanoate synthesis repressor PhaR [Martelella mediterranea]TCT28454.1 polyhydroxyalkanoate synthesis repressor PhaR [Martelella mediterranea]